MAEGMISSEDRIGEETMMDMAKRYLEELAKRCMIIIEMEETPSIIRFTSCRLHDLMREMCLHKAKEEKFLELIDYNASELVESYFVKSRSTRLAIHMGREIVKPRIEVIRRLRSFSFSVNETYDGRMPSPLKLEFVSFRMLRVLSIEGLNTYGPKIYREMYHILLYQISFFRLIGKLIHLRYLSLRDSAFFVIPSSISKLKHLQTLDLRSYEIRRIPNAIRKLRRLKHLYLPLDVCCKFNLNGLHNLEMLEKFNSRNNDMKELLTLTKLRYLQATVRDKLEDVDEFIVNQVNNLICLRFLSLEIKYCHFDSEKGSTVLRKLFSLSCLNHLVIHGGRISKLLEYESCFSPNLHTLRLESTKIEEDPMRTLEKLPNLTSLELWTESFMGEEMICHATGFPQLKFLFLYCLENLSNWLIEEGAMPKLSCLYILECKKMKMIPDGLRFVTTLKELATRYMTEEFDRRLQGEDFDKVRHVPSVTIM